MQGEMSFFVYFLVWLFFHFTPSVVSPHCVDKFRNVFVSELLFFCFTPSVVSPHCMDKFNVQYIFLCMKIDYTY